MAKRKRKKTGKSRGGAFGAPGKSKPPRDGAPASGLGGFQREKDRVMAAISRKMREQDFQSPEEAQAFLNEHLLKRSFDEILAEEAAVDSPETRALAELDKIRDSQSPPTIRKHAKAALKQDPNCIEAWVHLGDMSARVDKAKACYQKAVAAGRARFAGQIAEFTPDPGLWKVPECRPFMNACMDLAELHFIQEQTEDAVALYEELLDWNPDDNQGVRYELLRCHLSKNQWGKAEDLLDKYPDDNSCHWSYSRAFLVFCRVLEESEWTLPPIPADGDTLADPFADLPVAALGKATGLLRQAMEEQPFVPLLALDLRSAYLPQPEVYRWKSPSEALDYAHAWSVLWVAPLLPALWMLKTINQMGRPGLELVGPDEFLDELEDIHEELASIPADEIPDPSARLIAEAAQTLRENLLQGRGEQLEFPNWDRD